MCTPMMAVVQTNIHVVTGFRLQVHIAGYSNTISENLLWLYQTIRTFKRSFCAQPFYNFYSCCKTIAPTAEIVFHRIIGSGCLIKNHFLKSYTVIFTKKNIGPMLIEEILLIGHRENLLCHLSRGNIFFLFVERIKCSILNIIENVIENKLMMISQSVSSAQL